MQLELDPRLRTLAALARRNSFTGAAEELFVSQPAVSKHIRDLEQLVGVRLVVRQRRSNVLTPAGQFLATQVLRAEAILAQAERGVAAFRKLGSASLSLAASGTPGTYLLPPIIARFHEEYPGVELSVTLGTSSDVVQAVRTHHSELGIVGGFAGAVDIESLALLEDEIVVIGPPSFSSAAPRDLEETTWISREEGSATRAAVEAAWADLGISPQRRLEMPSWEAVKLLVASGAGVAACSRMAVELELAAKTLVIVPIGGWKVRRTISAIRGRDAPLTPVADRFIQMLKAGWSTEGSAPLQVG